MKIVINKCYGGFGLSPAGVQHYLKLKGKDCFFYQQKKYKHSDAQSLYVKIELRDIGNSIFNPYTSTIDLGESFSEWPKNNDGYFYDHDIKRDDPDLVKTVEDLGSEIASQQLGKLKVVEIPDGIKWYIEEYDGLEHVAENHETWG